MKNFNLSQQKTRKWLLTIFIALLPTLITLALLNGVFRVNIADFRPRMWNDQVGYWYWAKSFSAVGFDAGYNGWDETVAPASFNPYGENGPFYQILYGTIGKIVGWRNALPIYINMGLLTLAIIIFIKTTKLGNKQILHLGAILTLLFPILMYIPLSSHESLNQAIAILIASIFYILFNQKKSVNIYFKILFALFLFAASLIRLSWAILFLPLFFMLLEGKILKKIVFSFIISFLFGYASLRVSSYLLPPTGNIILELIKEIRIYGLPVLLNRIIYQIEFLFLNPHNRIDLIISLQALFLGIWNISYIVTLFKKKLRNTTETLPFFNLYNLLVPLGMGIVFYLVFGFHRIFATHILISALLLLTQKKYLPIYLSLLIGVLAFQPFGSWYEHVEVNYKPNTIEFTKTRRAIREYIIFDKETNNPWCNTVLFPFEDYEKYVSMFPAGIGASPIVVPKKLNYPLKSKYLLLEEGTLSQGRYPDHFHIEDLNIRLLDSIHHIDIYYNNDSGCPLD